MGLTRLSGGVLFGSMAFLGLTALAGLIASIVTYTQGNEQDAPPPPCLTRRPFRQHHRCAVEDFGNGRLCDYVNHHYCHVVGLCLLL